MMAAEVSRVSSVLSEFSLKNKIDLEVVDNIASTIEATTTKTFMV